MKTQQDSRRLLVTGAAAGIGAAVVRLALAAKWEVIGLDLADEELREDPRAGERITLLSCDVADEVSVGRAFAEIEERWSHGPSAVVHCAGIYRVRPSLSLSGAEWDCVQAVNGRGSFLIARESLRAMSRGTGDRSLVLMSSVGAERGDDREPSAAYSASKGAISSLTRQLAAEFGSSGIRVNAVAPGVIDTTMTTLTADRELSEDFFATRVPLRRVGNAEEVAEACIFLAGACASYISGVVLPVDGGQSIL